MAQSKNAESEILIVAAEASSALYARRLLEQFRTSNQKVKAYGIGSREMESLGFEILGRSEDLAVVGLTEVIKHYSEIRDVFNKIVSETEKRKPRLILLMDYPDFNLRLAKKLKPLGIPIFYYISPQVWAWRKSRIHDIKKLVDKMLVLLPFEKEFYKANGVDVEFVGHPLLDELNPALFDASERNVARNRYGVTAQETWIGLMPGSRNSEIKQHLNLQLQVAEKLHTLNPNLKFALLVAPNFSVDHIRSLIPSYSLPLTIVHDDPLKMVSQVDIVLCASGTATLVVGLLKKPMVIMYKMNPVTAFLAKMIVRGTEHFGLINLILGKRVVPELFQGEASVERLATEIMKFVEDKGYRASVENDLARAHEILGSKGATYRVAKFIEPYLF